MRSPICEIVLIVLLIQGTIHHSSPASKSRQSSDEKPVAIYAPKPQYPLDAKALRQAGAGVAILRVDPNTGYVREAVMGISTGSPILDSAALSAFRQWRFAPDGVAKINVPIRFTMKGAVTTQLVVMHKRDIDKMLTPFLGNDRVLNGPSPRYPLSPPWTNKQGDGKYELHVGKNGKVDAIKILKSSGDRTFDRVALETLQKWQLQRGPLVIELPLAFKLTPKTYDICSVRNELRSCVAVSLRMTDAVN